MKKHFAIAVTNPETQEKRVWELDIKFDNDGVNDHVYGSSNMTESGETVDIDMYSIKGDNSVVVVYSYNTETESWEKEDSGLDSLTSARMIPTSHSSDSLTLEETQDQYILTGTKDIPSLFLSARSESYPMSLLYFDGLSDDAHISYAFQKDTLQLESFSIDLTDAVEEYYLQTISGQEGDADAMKNNIEANEYGISITDIAYAPGEPVVLPDEAKDGHWTDGRNDEVEQALDIHVADSFDCKEEYKQVVFDGHTYDLQDLSLGRFIKENDLPLPEEWQGATIEAGQGENVAIVYDDNKHMVDLLVRNVEDRTLAVEDCAIRGFSSYFTLSDEFTIAGLGAGAAPEDLIAVLGNPTRATVGDDQSMTMYNWSNDEASISFGYDTESGALDYADIYLYE